MALQPLFLFQERRRLSALLLASAGGGCYRRARGRRRWGDDGAVNAYRIVGVEPILDQWDVS